MGNFAINGFGRIGRLAARIWFLKHQNSAALAAINTSGSMNLSGWAHLLKYDTIYGQFPANIGIEEHLSNDQVTQEDPLLGHLILDQTIKIPVLAQRSPELIPWSNYEIDLVIESTGVFRREQDARKHLSSGAKQVLISAPAKDGAVETVLLGVTDTPHGKEIYSNESCTTNCTSPIMSVIASEFGIQKATLTTTHAYTDDQNLQDGSHKDLRRARAAAANIIPTSTGAAIATTRTVKALENKFDGIAIRVPVASGSLIDLTILTNQPVTQEDINQALTKASESPKLKGILTVTDDPLVSSDILGRSESAIVDLSLTKVIDGDLVKIFAWYDNEWGFSNRLIETAVSLSSH